MTEKCYTYRLPDEKHFQGLCANRFFGVSGDCPVCVSPEENTINTDCVFPVMPSFFSVLLEKEVTGIHNPGTICFESSKSDNLLFTGSYGDYCEWVGASRLKPVVLEKYVNAFNPIQGCGSRNDISRFIILIDRSRTVVAELGIPSDINGIAPAGIAIRWKKQNIQSAFGEIELDFDPSISYNRASEFFDIPAKIVVNGV
jgi:hypothetical protein